MAFQGFALFALSAIGLASLLYYMYANNATQEQSYSSDPYPRNPNTGNWSEETWENGYSQTSKNQRSSSQRKRKRQSKSSHPNQKADIVCTICLQTINNEEMRLPCDHTFHVKCIEEWKSQGPIISRYTCPNCRKSYSNI